MQELNDAQKLATMASLAVIWLASKYLGKGKKTVQGSLTAQERAK